jgi:hypothetical protein
MTKRFKPFGAAASLTLMKTKLLVLLFALLTAASSFASVTAEQAKQQFERMKRLAGTWQARSTRGWEGRYTVRVIARGSAILITSEFVDEPGEGMATLYYLDGEQLKLTHYCEARNQPTLVLTELAEGGKRAEFAFVSGTGMASRDVGHMDGLVVRFDGDDAHHDRWSWYAKGKERWMEDIEYRRVAAHEQ